MQERYMTESAKERTFNMRLSPEEWDTFERVAASQGLPVASMLRLLVKRESEKLFDGRPTWRKLVTLVIAEAERGQDATGDYLAIQLNVPWQKARNAALMLAREGVLKETTKGDPNIPPRRTFVPGARYRTLDKAIAAITDTLKIDPDESI
jgi:hypothetical protein